MRFIVKSNDNLRQEEFAMQLISQLDQIFRGKNLNLWLKTYEIMGSGLNAGLIECIYNAVSLDALKKKILGLGIKSLEEFFSLYFHTPKSTIYIYIYIIFIYAIALKFARRNFARSLAAYSLVCYILQIKDRHNGNILLDNEGHVIHIDFGFLISNSPGGGIQFESAPFKLTAEFVEVLGGHRSKFFKEFRDGMVAYIYIYIYIYIVDLWLYKASMLNCFY